MKGCIFRSRPVASAAAAPCGTAAAQAEEVMDQSWPDPGVLGAVLQVGIVVGDSDCGLSCGVGVWVCQLWRPCRGLDAAMAGACGL